MPREPPPLRPVTTLLRVAARLSPGAVPAGHHRSHPIPAPGPEGLRVGFLFAPVRAYEDPESHERAPRLWATEYLAWVDAESGAFAELRHVTAKDLDMAEPAAAPGGEPAPLAGPAPAPGDFDALHQAYDAVLAWFAAGHEQVPPPVRARVRELDGLFRELAEPGLVPYYRKVGEAFFAWVDRVRA